MIIIVIMTSITVVLLLLLSNLYRLYRFKQKAYLDLCRQIEEKNLRSAEHNLMTTQSELLSQSFSKHYNEALSTSATTPRKGKNEHLHHQQQQHLVARLRDYILADDHFMKNDIDRHGLIAALSSNRTSLSEAVKAVTNKTLMEYINFLRLEEAKRMLDKHHEFTIEAIAEKYGFSLRTFHRLFSEHYHISPAKYRKIQFQKKTQKSHLKVAGLTS